MKLFKKQFFKKAKKIYKPNQITTLSQLGSRVSIAELHIKKVLRAFKDDHNSNHVFYVVDPENKKLVNFVNKYRPNPKVTIYTRNDNYITDFKRLKDSALGGGDANYDFLIKLPEIGSYFLTLHDDSIIKNSQISSLIRVYMVQYDFCGYLDSRKITQYSNLLIDGTPLSEIRLGTWFIFGKSEVYVNSNYKMGLYKTINLKNLNKMFGKTTRLKLLSDNIWLNGGMPFNIQARLDNRTVLILNNHPAVLAEHLTKVTGFFAARGMLKYSDTLEEIGIWRKRFIKLHNLPKDKLETLYNDPKFDRKFMLNLAKCLEEEGIYDSLLNTETIETISLI